MSLPANWVSKIFDKLTLIYGREFKARWDGMSIEDVKSDWSHELSGFADKPESIAYALKNLPPDRPPTALQFRDLCRKAPPKVLSAISYKPSGAGIDAAKSISAVITGNRPDPKAWARKLKAREEAGERLSPIQKGMWRESLQFYSPIETDNETEARLEREAIINQEAA
jgi:hypothetical protein